MYEVFINAQLGLKVNALWLSGKVDVIGLLSLKYLLWKFYRLFYSTALLRWIFLLDMFTPLFSFLVD